jgi:hypothetical protein
MLSLALFMRETTIRSRNVMRITRMPIDCERNNKISSEKGCYLIANIPCKELSLGQAVSPQRCLQHRDSKQTVTQKFQDDHPPIKMWIDFLVHNDRIPRPSDIMFGRSFRYRANASITHDLENKVVSTITSIFRDCKGGGKV